MYYNDYEDYMRNVLGYSNACDSTYQRYDDNCCVMGCSNANYNNMNYNNMPYGNMAMNQMNQFQDRNDSATIEQMYPEIYRIINPMVCRMCDNNIQPVTEYLIEQMTDDIYDNVVNRVEIQNVINLNIGTREADVEVNVDREESGNNRSVNTAASSRSGSNSSNSNAENSTTSKIVNSVKSEEDRETRSPQGQCRRRNRLLRDLIRILILNRLLRRNRPNRPPFRPGPGQRPGMPGNNRPPMPRLEDNCFANGYMPYL